MIRRKQGQRPGVPVPHREALASDYAVKQMIASIIADPFATPAQLCTTHHIRRKDWESLLARFPLIKEAWDEAMLIRADRVDQVVLEQAEKGIIPGHVVKRWRPEYNEKSKVEVTRSEMKELSDEELEALIAAREKTCQ